MAFKYAIALTGGIASGKSSACNLLRLFGLRIIDADAIAHEVLELNKDVIAKEFGDNYIKNGIIDRKALGSLIFSDKKAKKALEGLLHPQIKSEIIRQSEEQDKLKGAYLIDIPLFFETANYPIDKVIVVYAPRTVQKQRLIKREGLSQEQAEAILDAQIDIEEKKKRATWVIDNSFNLKHLQQECERVLSQIATNGTFN